MSYSRISAVSMLATVVFLIAVSSLPLCAQQATTANAAVPTLVQFSGVLINSNGKPMTGMTGVTFALYTEQEGGAPLWLETQNVQPDKNGNYTVQLGSTTSQGLPSSLFVSGQARWLEVQPQGQEPRPRIMLLSVPYALKAGDAQTIGGKPASSFMLAPPASQPGATDNSPTANITGGGTTNYIPRFTGTTTIGNSKIYQNASGDIGVNTTSPAANLDVKGKTDVRDTLTLFPKSSHPSLSVNGTAFQVSNTGNVTFVSGQTFPGTGTITGVTAGTDLTGGGNSGNVTVNLDTTKVPQLAAANSFTNNNAVSVNSSSTALQVINAGGGDALDVFPSSSGVGMYTTGGYLGVYATGGLYPVYGNGGSAAGVLGSSAASSAVGTMGLWSSASTVGAGTGGTGVWGDSSTGNGVTGTSDDEHGGYFVNNSSSGKVALEADSINGGAGLFFALNWVTNGWCDIDQNANLLCTGSKSAVVSVDGGARRVALYAIEGPENWFEDAGTGHLTNGSEVVTLEPVFAQTINASLDYHVFLTPRGDCKGLYVSNAGPSSFEVHELGGGTSSLDFDYRIMAKRKGYEDIRLADKTRQLENTGLIGRRSAASVPSHAGTASAR